MSEIFRDDQEGWSDDLPFEVTSGKLRVTDPCYDRNTWCADSLDVMNGEWLASVLISDEEDWGMRVARLLVWNKAHYPGGAPVCSIHSPASIGVDSGQAGFFDDASYPNGDCGEYNEPDTFYGKACTLTHGGSGGIINGRGVVVSSGFGDGGYDLFFETDKVTGLVAAAELVFIPDDEDREEEDDNPYASTEFVD